jgi:flagellar assembly protein FliH
MMSLSSRDSAGSLEYPEVEAFVYHDTPHAHKGGAAPDASAQSTISSDGSAESSRQIEENLAGLIMQAREEGRLEGERRALAKTEEDIDRERKRIAETLEQFQRERSEYYSKVEAELVQLALAIAAKILHREAQVDRMLVAGLVKVAIEKLQLSANIAIRVPQGQAAIWQQHFNHISNLRVVEDASLTINDCVLETDAGSAYLGLDAQLKEVEQGFFDLLAQRPAAK